MGRPGGGKIIINGGWKCAKEHATVKTVNQNTRNMNLTPLKAIIVNGIAHILWYIKQVVEWSCDAKFISKI